MPRVFGSVPVTIISLDLNKAVFSDSRDFVCKSRVGFTRSLNVVSYFYFAALNCARFHQFLISSFHSRTRRFPIHSA